jgi:hypothetical protein
MARSRVPWGVWLVGSHLGSQANLADGLDGIAAADFGCCTNVLLDPNPEAQVSTTCRFSRPAPPTIPL